MCEFQSTTRPLARLNFICYFRTGKWHLGQHRDTFGDNIRHPLAQGFDYFYGTIGTNLDDFGNEGKIILSQRPYWYGELLSTWLVTAVSLWCLLKTRHVPLPVFCGLIVMWTAAVLYLYFIMDNLTLLGSFLHRNYDLVEQPIRLAGLSQRLVHEGIEFMRNATESGKPFLVVMSWIHMHVAIKTAKEFEGKSGLGAYGDALMELDWSVGEMLNALKTNGVDKNTLVYFTSDNGGHVEIGNVGGYNGVLKGLFD